MAAYGRVRAVRKRFAAVTRKLVILATGKPYKGGLAAYHARVENTDRRSGRGDDPVVRTSKLLSKILRHQPGLVGLELEPGGWVVVDDLLAALARHGHPIDRTWLEHVVATNDKRRFAFDASGTRIRASQGHSTGTDLGLAPTEPPAELYHGTPERTAPIIACEGIDKMRRDHVHLSPDVPTAIRVGARRGKPVVFAVDAAAMHRDGHVFFLSENGVWLTDHVPPGYLRPAGVVG